MQDSLLDMTESEGKGEEFAGVGGGAGGVESVGWVQDVGVVILDYANAHDAVLEGYIDEAD